MEIQCLMMGKNRFSQTNDLLAMYTKRIQAFAPFKVETIKAASPKLNTTAALKEETQKWDKKIKPQAIVVMLDERGKQWTSKDFAQKINTEAANGIPCMQFLFGSAYGFHQSMYERSYELLSISKMTMMHDWARLCFLEQIYRAFTINRNMPYHH